jgi:hypothetical protein
VNLPYEFSIKVTSLVCTALRSTVDYVIVYIADTCCQIANVKTKAATKYAVKVLSDFMLE